jgi:hypothetical protein
MDKAETVALLLNAAIKIGPHAWNEADAINVPIRVPSDVLLESVILEKMTNYQSGELVAELLNVCVFEGLTRLAAAIQEMLREENA